MGVLNSFFARGWGIRPSKKLPGGFDRGWSGLELTDTLASELVPLEITDTLTVAANKVSATQK